MLQIHPHAFTHGVAERDIRAAFVSGFDGALAVDDGPLRWLVVGFDTAGRPTQLVVVAKMEPGDHLAIHALRPPQSATYSLLRGARKVRRR